MDNKTKGLLMGAAGLLVLSASKKAKAVSLPVYPPIPPFTENRVRWDDYGPLKEGSPFLTPVDSSGAPQRVHVLLANRLDALKQAASRDGFNNIKIASGWRPHPWRSWDHYVERMVQRYGSLEEGRKWVAFKSPHETGLAIDFGSHGLAPISKTNDIQKQTPFYAWLVNNAHKYGFTPYMKEAWHWETKIPQTAWASGQEFTSDYGAYV